VAAQRVGVQVEQFTWKIAGGFQTAITVFVGQNFGARQYTRIRKGMKIMALILIPYAMVITSLLFFVPEFLIRIFIDGPVTVAYGVRYLRIISFAQLFMMLEAIGSGLFNGVGKTEIPSISGIISNALRIPIAYLLIQSLQQEGIWWALNISDCLKGMVMLVGSIILLMMLEKLKLTEHTSPYIEATEELYSA
ncbi:MAG: MATE family efflux transporter, partial [Bacilli bacterium]|nr:MATE family efflux transporter [Bacilli bacterium]